MKFTRIKWLSLFLTLVMLTACTVVAPQPATNTESPAPAMQPTPEPTALPAPEPTAEPAPETSTSGTASPVVGRWVGQISVAGQALDIVVQFVEQDGVLSGNIDIPQQGAGHSLRQHHLQCPADWLFHAAQSPDRHLRRADGRHGYHHRHL